MVTDSSILRLRSIRSTLNQIMISVTIYVEDEHYTGIDFLGHAGNAGQPVSEQELVCSAVSALTINLANSVERFTHDPFENDVDETDGLFRFRFTGKISSDSILLMNSLIFGLQNIEEAYGEPYIKIRYKEV